MSAGAETALIDQLRTMAFRSGNAFVSLELSLELVRLWGLRFGSFSHRNCLSVVRVRAALLTATAATTRR